LVGILYVSWERAVDLCYKLATMVAHSGFRPDAIIAVLRGGVVPALIVSDVLGVDGFYAVRARHWGVLKEAFEKPIIEQLPQGRLEGARILVVDEVADTGKTLDSVVEQLKRLNPSEIRTAVVHLKPTSRHKPSYYAESLDRWLWIFYPWSLVETVFALAVRELGGRAPREAIEERVEQIAKSLGLTKRLQDALRTGMRYYLQAV